MNPEHSIYDAIHEAHAIASTPTRGEHDISDPDPYCWGDDPCVCVQLKAAREDERNRLIARWLTEDRQQMEDK